MLQPIVASMKISLVTVIPWRQQLVVNMNYSRKSARLLANVKTKFTEMLNVHCTRLSGEGLYNLIDTYQRWNCRLASYKFDSKQWCSFSSWIYTEICFIHRLTKITQSMMATLDFDIHLALQSWWVKPSRGFLKLYNHRT